jgi:hypothetical protein
MFLSSNPVGLKDLKLVVLTPKATNSQMNRFSKGNWKLFDKIA